MNNNQEPSNDDDYISKFKKMNEEYVESTKKEEEPKEEIKDEDLTDEEKELYKKLFI
ncbi:hypothetical protein OFR75_12015 [Brachyspira hyodysenteriae]|uniref:hypothetical protein n=1 Tax=Brachyspira hyodysenteriae TaxID=159 RepID=UPI0022CD5C3C|nr:hypothetical protein [Brachyspira hyodysenteriae]MCZ9963990.1 hypothetical protein [Brachyspira hyodysenteriae]MDA0095747.1 hypothetical protein [Brachyspira hyodysenteriae]